MKRCRRTESVYTDKRAKSLASRNSSDHFSVTGIIRNVKYPQFMKDFTGWAIVELDTYAGQNYVMRGHIPFIDLAFEYTFLCRNKGMGVSRSHFGKTEVNIEQCVEIRRRPLTDQLIAELLVHHGIFNRHIASLQVAAIANFSEDTLKEQSWYQKLAQKTPYFLGDEAAMVFSYFGPGKLLSILKKGMDDMLRIVEIAKTEPQRLCAEPMHGFEGIGDMSVDGMEKCCKRYGIRLDAYITASLRYYQTKLNTEMVQDGHTYMDQETFNKMGISRKAKKYLLDNGILVHHEDKYYHHKSWRNRQLISESIREMFERGLKGSRIAQREQSTEEDHVLTLDPEQLQAIDLSFKSPIVCVNGPAGTGKTSGVAKNIINWHPANSYIVAAPTGMASRRICEATGYPSSTIDMLVINIKMASLHIEDKGEQKQKKSECETDEEEAEAEDNIVPLLYETEGVILDESSMINENLLARLLPLLVNLRQIVFVGDPNQISPIGYGYPYKDIITKYPKRCVYLEKNHRVDANSRTLVELSKMVLKREQRFGELVTLNGDLNASSNPIVFMQRDKQGYIENIKKILDTVPVPQHRQVQFLAHKNNTCQDINKYYFNRYHRPSRQFGANTKNKEFVTGQRIIFTKNHYGKRDKSLGIDSSPVNNGEIDYIEEIADELYLAKSAKPRASARSEERESVISFACSMLNIPEESVISPTNKFQLLPPDDRYTVKSTSEQKRNGYRRILKMESGKRIDLNVVGLNNIEYGNCITGNKSQGNEYPVVVLILEPNVTGEISRNFVHSLLYTILTRARKQLIVVADFTKKYPNKNYNYGEFEKIVMEHDDFFRRHNLASALPDIPNLYDVET